MHPYKAENDKIMITTIIKKKESSLILLTNLVCFPMQQPFL